MGQNIEDKKTSTGTKHLQKSNKCRLEKTENGKIVVWDKMLTSTTRVDRKKNTSNVKIADMDKSSINKKYWLEKTSNEEKSTAQKVEEKKTSNVEFIY
jgi:hypothetical protein